MGEARARARLARRGDGRRGASCGGAGGARTVSLPPSIVPVHWKMLSPSGNAETPPSLPIMRLINSLCNLRNCGGEL